MDEPCDFECVCGLGFGMTVCNALLPTHFVFVDLLTLNVACCIGFGCAAESPPCCCPGTFAGLTIAGEAFGIHFGVVSLGLPPRF